MKLIINNKCIDTPIPVILKKLKSELKNGLLSDIGDVERDNVLVTCPNHKNGMERHTSCNIYCREDNPNVEYGKAHCFTCGYTVSLPQFIGKCFEETEAFGKEWLLENFGTSYNSNYLCLPEINIDKSKKNKFLNENELKKYAFYHPYMWKRKLSKNVVDYFKIGFDSKSNSITFPVWDSSNRLVMITRRNVDSKIFNIPKDVEKPVYLLNEVIKQGITRIIVTEGQIDALTAWSYGVPAVATMGSPSCKQIQSLNFSGVRIIITMFDNDNAGERFTKKIDELIRKDIILLHAKLPRVAKDINDLTQQQFEEVMRNLT